MKKTRIDIDSPLTSAEKFFVEKTYELISENTIDTFRIRLNNPKTAIEELQYLIKSYNKKNISEDYPRHHCAETHDLLNMEEELRFGRINKHYFLQLLSKKEYTHLFYVITIILNDNNDYSEILFNSIESEIIRINSLEAIHVSEYKKLNRLVSYLLVELRRKGFNKAYLQRTIHAIFSGGNTNNDFSYRFNALKTIAKKSKEKFKVYIAINAAQSGKKYFDNNPITLQFEKRGRLLRYAATINLDFKKFIDEAEVALIYSIEIDAIDYYSATIETRKIIQKALDLCFLGDERDVIQILPKCFVVGSLDPKKARPQNLNYKLDGDIRGSYNTFQRFTRKLDSLSGKKIEKNSLEKLYSGLRYLRLGNEAQSGEQRLINYWIAIEYLFSSYDGGGNKTTRLKEYFKKIHSLTYVRKLFYDLHNSIKNFGLSGSLSLYDRTNISYLTNVTTETELFVNLKDSPLLCFRFFQLNEKFADARSIGKELSRHMNNLERNILRIYRVRNQIVHNAAADSLKDDIFELAAHLKYYLIFVLNGLIEFLIEHPIDVDNDEGIGIDDYFIITSLRLESLMFKKTLTAAELIGLNSPIEYLK